MKIDGCTPVFDLVAIALGLVVVGIGEFADLGEDLGRGHNLGHRVVGKGAEAGDRPCQSVKSFREGQLGVPER